MTIDVDRDALLGAVRQVSAAVQSRNQIPILSTMLIDFSGDRLTVTGTDLDQQVRVECQAAGDPLRTAIPADKLLAAIDSLKAGRVRVSPVENKASVTLRQERSVRTLPTLPANDFPEMPNETGSARFAMAAAAFERLIEATHRCQGDDVTRTYLNGVHLSVVNQRLRAQATDALHLVRAETDLPDGAAGMPMMIVSSKTISLARKLICGNEGDVEIEASSAKILLASGSVTIIAKLIEGTYPDLDRIIPSGGGHEVRVRCAVLADAARSVALIVEGEGQSKARTVRFTCANDGEPELSALDQMGASSVEPLPSTYEGEGIVFGVNARHIAALASVFREASELKLVLSANNIPMRITADDEPDLVAACGVMRI